MTVEEVKNELKRMEAPVLQEITSFIVRLRRSQDPLRGQVISDKLDAPEARWFTLDQVDERLDRE